jgi:hypothetical protein
VEIAAPKLVLSPVLRFIQSLDIVTSHSPAPQRLQLGQFRPQLHQLVTSLLAVVVEALPDMQVAAVAAELLLAHWLFQAVRL